MKGLELRPFSYYRWTFQGQEEETTFGLNLAFFKWRIEDKPLGRFWSIDPLAESYYYNSTYAFSENKVTSHFELEGLEAIYFNKEAQNNKNFKDSYTIQRQTTGGKQVMDKFKNQTNYNLIYFASSKLLENGSIVPIKNMEQFQYYKDRVAKFKLLVSGDTYKEISENGKKGVIFLFFNTTNYNKSNLVKLLNSTATLNHEEVAHLLDILDGNLKDASEDHEVYFGVYSYDSPSTEDVLDPNGKYKNSKARQQLDEILNILKENIERQKQMEESNRSIENSK